MYRSFLPLVFLVMTGCLEGTKPTATAPRSLYDRMGGGTVIVKVVDDFVTNVVKDPDIREKHKKHFMKDDVASLKKKLVDQIGQATGGPQKYTGKNMKEAHQGLGITDKDFDALAGDLAKALEQNQVGKAEQKELMTMLGGMRKEIVEAKDGK